MHLAIAGGTAQEAEKNRFRRLELEGKRLAVSKLLARPFIHRAMHVGGKLDRHGHRADAQPFNATAALRTAGDRCVLDHEHQGSASHGRGLLPSNHPSTQPIMPRFP